MSRCISANTQAAARETAGEREKERGTSNLTLSTTVRHYILRGFLHSPACTPRITRHSLGKANATLTWNAFSAINATTSRFALRINGSSSFFPISSSLPLPESPGRNLGPQGNPLSNIYSNNLPLSLFLSLCSFSAGCALFLSSLFQLPAKFLNRYRLSHVSTRP